MKKASNWSAERAEITLNSIIAHNNRFIAPIKFTPQKFFMVSTSPTELKSPVLRFGLVYIPIFGF